MIKISKILLLLAVFAILVFVVAEKGMKTMEMETRDSSVAALRTVLTTTTESIQIWMENYKDKARIIAIDPPLVDIVQRQLDKAREQESLLRGPELGKIRDYVRARHRGLGFFVIAPDFVNVVSSGEDDLGAESVIVKENGELLGNVFAQGEAAMTAPMLPSTPVTDSVGRLVEDYPVMFAISPIRDRKGKVIAALALTVDPAIEFSGITQLGRIGLSGESYVINKAGMMLTASRFLPHLLSVGLLKEGETGILSIQIRDPGGNMVEGFTPATKRENQPLTYMAESLTQEITGCREDGYRDYRGMRVLGCWAWARGLGMGVVTEIDEEEALGPFYIMRFLFFTILGITVSLSALLSLAVTHIQSSYSQGLLKAQKDSELFTEELARANEELRTAMGDLRRHEQLLQTIIDNTTAVIYLKDREGKYILINRRYSQLIRKGKEEAKGKTDYDLFPKEVADRLVENDLKAMLGSAPHEVEEEAVFGEKKHVYLSMKFPLRRISGDPYAICNISTDITERKRTEEKLQLAASVFENSAEGVIVTDAQGIIQSVNPAFVQITGYIPQEAVGKNPSILKSGKHDAGFYKMMWMDLETKGRWKGEIWNRKKNGEAYLQKTTITAIKDFSGSVIQYAAVFYDITEMRRSEKEVEYKAYHDALTGLPNRQLFLDRLKQTIMRGKRNKEMFAVLFVDLDGFKLINDSLGHAVGDLLLRGVAIRLVGCAREEDTVARLGGDEFTIIIENMAMEEEAATVARRIIKSLTEPFVSNNEELYISSSVGISVYPHNGETAEDLLKNADLAMYNVKTVGKNNFMFFTKSLNEKAVRRHELETKLRRALEKDEISAVFQPKIDLATGRMAGLEALMRWRQPDGSYISPFEFIPVAEETGMIRKLDEWMLDTSCRFMNQLLADGLAGDDDGGLSVSVNFSARDLEQVNFVDKIIEATKRHGLSPGRIEVELTENALVENIESAVDKLRALRECGFNISIDDFGIGYSSLSYLVKFPINYLKLDRSFVVDLFKDPDAKTVAKAVVTMAHEINLKVVAEGVETLEQLSFLSGINCDQVQGYIFCKPVSSEQIVEILKKNEVFTSTP
ncbi:MAG: EAL domain-containing protein [Nitrospinota bacterium]|nr:EAL domain-containing protein [Nitrospinota bacterium]